MKTPSSTIPVTFFFESGRPVDLGECRRFWHAPQTIQWFQDHGYTYEPPDEEIPYIPSPGQLTEVEYPYANYDSSGKIPLGALDVSGKVVFAQDSSGRHVAIKIVKTDTDEYRILQFLHQQSFNTLKENCLLPVLDFLYNAEFTFVVMPRWGPAVNQPLITEAKDILETIHSLLKALAFLHEHNIAHGDITFGNVLVNHFSDSISLNHNFLRANLRSQGRLLYALFDFDFSIMLSAGADRTEYRLPYYQSWGSFNCTMDTAQGEFDFNPFVMDVGAMGVRFCYQYQHLTGEIPMLAPLLDKMTTRDLQRRFTASEALQFFEHMSSQLTETDLHRPVDTRFEILEIDLNYDEYDRWKRVPSAFAEKWIAFKEPPIPWTTRILRAIYRAPYMCLVVPPLRKRLYLVWTGTQQVFTDVGKLLKARFDFRNL